MTKIDTEHFKKKLLEEKTKLISELETVARINPDNPKSDILISKLKPYLFLHF